jgi:hypothetical protein
VAKEIGVLSKKDTIINTVSLGAEIEYLLC